MQIGDHSSRAILTEGLKQPTRAVSAETCLANLATRAPPLFGLAPGGVYHAVSVTADAVRSYRTLSLFTRPKPKP